MSDQEDDLYGDFENVPDNAKKPCNPGRYWLGILYLIVIIIFITLIWTNPRKSSTNSTIWTNRLVLSLLTVLFGAIGILVTKRLHNHCKKLSMWIVFFVFVGINSIALLIL